MANNGQACEAGTRLLVPASIKDEFTGRLAQRAATLKLGDPLSPATDVGPVITRDQQQRILAYLEGARAQGATALVGGGVPKGPEFEAGNWIEPTILTGVTNDMTVAREEVFGPVLTVLTYDTIEEAIAIANDTSYGLSAGVWGRDEQRALDVARRLEAGMVYVNDWHVINPAYPFGGYKQSGLGREGGADALDEYTEQKYISVDRAGPIQNRAFGLVVSAPQAS
jgi:aldehyde dehydrogenase (NAD+)